MGLLATVNYSAKQINFWHQTIHVLYFQPVEQFNEMDSISVVIKQTINLQTVLSLVSKCWTVKISLTNNISNPF